MFVGGRPPATGGAQPLQREPPAPLNESQKVIHSPCDSSLAAYLGSQIGQRRTLTPATPGGWGALAPGSPIRPHLGQHWHAGEHSRRRLSVGSVSVRTYGRTYNEPRSGGTTGQGTLTVGVEAQAIEAHTVMHPRRRGHTGHPVISMTDPRPTTNGLPCTSRCGGEEVRSVSCDPAGVASKGGTRAFDGQDRAANGVTTVVIDVGVKSNQPEGARWDTATVQWSPLR
jgi:hypothetical protein